ncbi:hypothetical protein OKW21_002127 [Catalinimonas alkaloidigena]|nr:hypothetical protein [Catalinimonas alkaloidigena]
MKHASCKRPTPAGRCALEGWVVYAKRPFQHPKSVVEYLGRYTHKIAIARRSDSNHRILNLDNGQVTFSYKDYRKGAQKLQMSLSDKEFIRRFSQHILPRGFVRMRHYGFLSSFWKPEKLPSLQQMLGLLPSSDDQEEPVSHRKCCACGSGTLQTMSMFYGRVRPGRLRRKSGWNASQNNRTISEKTALLSVTGKLCLI